MQINRKELEAALYKCLPGVDTGKMLIEGADAFIFEDGRIYSYNDRVSVSTLFPHELSGAVKAMEFYKLIAKAPKEEIKIAVINGEDDEVSWKIKSGNAIAELSLLESSVINHVKSLNIDSLKWKKIPSNFINGLETCRIGCNKSALAGIYVKDDVMVSTDEMTVNWYTLSGKMENFWIDSPEVNDLMKFSGFKEYSLSNGWIHFKFEDGTVFSCKRLTTENFLYNTVEGLIKNHVSQTKVHTMTLPKKLSGAVERASTLAMSAMDSYQTVQLTFKPEHIEVKSQRTTGKYSEKIPWDEKVEDMDTISVYVDCTMLSRILKRELPFYISDNNDQQSLIFKTDGYIHFMSTFSEDE